jgi:hypothetical protein
MLTSRKSIKCVGILPSQILSCTVARNFVNPYPCHVGIVSLERPCDHRPRRFYCESRCFCRPWQPLLLIAADHPYWSPTLQPEPLHPLHSSIFAAMSHAGTRSTPKPNRNQAAAGVPAASPSGIPRPALDTHASHVAQSEVGGSTLSASRAKMAKRDEVGAASWPPLVLCLWVNRLSDARSIPT